MTHYDIPFHRSRVSPNTLEYLKAALEFGKWGANQKFSKHCESYISSVLKHEGHTPFVRLTHSCTSALNMAMLCLGLKEGDEVIMPSWTFASTANAVALRGALPVLVDIESTTLNIDPNAVAEALTPRTKAIIAVHYAGRCCDMDTLYDFAIDRNLYVIEDAAQAFGSTYKGRPAGVLGDIASFSFHTTKHISCGEGGAFIYNGIGGQLSLKDRVDCAWMKGTNVIEAMQEKRPFYEWTDLGAAYAPSEITAAVLYASLHESPYTILQNMRIWGQYSTCFGQAWNGVDSSLLTLPSKEGNGQNGFCFYILTPWQNELIAYLADRHIQAQAHYRPLHMSSGGEGYARKGSPELPNTERVSSQIVRLPMTITENECYRVIEAVLDFPEFKIQRFV